jgi:hypothetical protein
MSLEFISILQKSLRSSCQVQDLFDLALGTSVGMCVMQTASSTVAVVAPSVLQ